MAIDKTKKIKKVTVDGSPISFNTQTKTITANGQFTPSANYIGFDHVTVSVPQPTFNHQPTMLKMNIESSGQVVRLFVISNDSSQQNDIYVSWGDGSDRDRKPKSVFGSLNKYYEHSFSQQGEYYIHIGFENPTTQYNNADLKRFFYLGIRGSTTPGKGGIFGGSSNSLTGGGSDFNKNCRDLVYIKLGTNAAISQGAFSNCTNAFYDLSETNFNQSSDAGFANAEYIIYQEAFRGAGSDISSKFNENVVELSSRIYSIGNGAFASSPIKYLKICSGSGVINLGYSSAIPSTITAIYVPREKIATYQTATNWSAYASKMVAY